MTNPTDTPFCPLCRQPSDEQESTHAECLAARPCEETGGEHQFAPMEGREDEFKKCSACGVAVEHDAEEFKGAALERFGCSEAEAVTVGSRVRLRRDVDRYPHFIAREGVTGTVTLYERKEGGVTLYAKMDEKIEGAETWDNEVRWDDTVTEDVFGDVEVLGSLDS